MNKKLVALTLAMSVGTSAEMTEADKKHYSPVVSEGHLFRPLGWKAPDLTPRYNLLGTKVVGKDAETGTWAYMSRSNDWGVVTVIKEGVEFAGSVVTEITNRKVVMENGDVYRQSAVEFLDNKSNKRKSNAPRSESKNDGTVGSSRRSQQNTAQRTERMSRRQSGRSRGRGQGNARWQEQIERFQSASPDERSRMIEQFRSQRGRNR
jgi:hypothetical protein|tara:strand:+ start:3460 stop:4080 length:621 start_codon:yes stop_codon:yes gene_type:complete